MFQIGDKVVCIDTADNPMVSHREVYTVKRVLKAVLNVEETHGFFSHRRFKLLSEFKDFLPGDRFSVFFTEEQMKGERIDGLHINNPMKGLVERGGEFSFNRYGNPPWQNCVGLVKQEDGDRAVVWLYPPNTFTYLGPKKEEEMKKEIAKPAQPVAPVKKAKKPRPLVLRSELRKQQKLSAGPGVCSYSLQFSNGHIRHQVNDVCHARARFVDYYDDKHVDKKGTIAGLALLVGQYDVASTPYYKEYVKFILNESPWASCFKTKNVGVAFRYGILMDVSKPLSEVVGACIALREGSEFFKWREKVFEQVKKWGFSNKIAYLVSCCFDLTKDGFKIKHQDGSHKSWSGEMNAITILSFLKGGYPANDAEKPMSTNRDYYSVDDHTNKVVKNVFDEKKTQTIGVGTLNAFIKNNVKTKEREEGEGWARVIIRVVTPDDLKKFCNFLKDLLS